MLDTHVRGAALALAAVLPPLFAAPASALVAYDFGWTGANGYAMDGTLSFDDALDGTGVLTFADLTSFDVTMVHNADVLAERTLGDFTFGLNFDSDAGAFVTGGGWRSGDGQYWRKPGDYGFSSNFGAEYLLDEEGSIEESKIDQDKTELFATRVGGPDAAVPVPAAGLLLGSTLAAIAGLRRACRPAAA